MNLVVFPWDLDSFLQTVKRVMLLEYEKSSSFMLFAFMFFSSFPHF